MFARWIKRLGVATTVLAAVACGVSVVGPGSLPSETSVLLRAHGGHQIAWPAERWLDDAFRVRKPKLWPGARGRELEARVAGTAAVRYRLHPDPNRPDRYPAVTVIHLRGTPYVMGYVYGRVLRDEIVANVTRHMMPAVYRMAWPRQLDRAWRAVEPFIPAAYLEEMRGIADGSGVSLTLLQRMHAVPEISEQMCSGLAWQNAITRDGASYHVRILDYATDLDVQQHPVIAFHQPLDELGNEIGVPYVNIAWAGFHWSVGGVNAAGLAIGEIGGGAPDAVEGERAEGEPMGVLVRRVLNDAVDVPGAEALLRDAQRNLRYVYVLSDPDRASKVLAGPTLFRVTRPGEWLESLGPGYEELPGFPSMIWHGANHRTHIQRFERRATDLTLDDLHEHNRAVALRKNLQAWVLRRDGCRNTGCETLELWVQNALGKYDRAVDQPAVQIDLNAGFGTLIDVAVAQTFTAGE